MRFMLGLFGLLISTSSVACYEATITKPSPFMGNNDEIFVLSDGSVWQVKYEYEYLYEYSPRVIICPDENILIVNGKKLTVDHVSGSTSTNKSRPTSSSNAIQSRIDGESEGWDGESIYQLTNGQVWQQTEYYYKYKYKYRPEVIIFRTDSGFKMQIEGIERAVRVARIK